MKNLKRNLISLLIILGISNTYSQKQESIVMTQTPNNQYTDMVCLTFVCDTSKIDTVELYTYWNGQRLLQEQSIERHNIGDTVKYPYAIPKFSEHAWRINGHYYMKKRNQ